MEAPQLLVNLKTGVNDLKSVNCPNCQKAIVFEKLGALCPSCEERYYGASIKQLIFSHCTECLNQVKYISCPHCEKPILVHESLSETNFICSVRFDLSMDHLIVGAIQEISELSKKNEDNELLSFFNDKAKKFIGQIFHNFDLKSEIQATERIQEMYNNNLLSNELLVKQVELRKKEAESDVEKNKVEILKEAVKDFDKLTPLLKVHLLTSLYGTKIDNINDITFDEEYVKFKIKIKEEELRKLKIENDHDEWKKKEARKNADDI